MLPGPLSYAPNCEGLSYKTVWLGLREIEPVAKKLGAKPTKTEPNGWVVSLTCLT